MQATTSLSLTFPAMMGFLGPSRFLTTSQRLMRVEAPAARGVRETPQVRFARGGRRRADDMRREHQPSDRYWSPWHHHGGAEGQAVCR